MKLFAAVVSLVLAGAGAAAAEPKLYNPNDRVPDAPYEVRGWLEHGRLLPSRLLLDVKLDTGALNSSIDAEIEGFFDANGDPIDAKAAFEALGADHTIDISVVFDVENETGRRRRVETRVVRWAEIKRKQGGTIPRPVVELSFCVAGLYLEGEVNLADRGNLNYPVLIGRNMLRDSNILIDSRESYTYRSTCSPPKT